MKLKSLIPALAAVFFASCATVEVTTDYDHSMDFTKFKSFAIYERINNQSVSSLNQDRIIKSIEAQLTAKGYVLGTEAAPADFYVNVNTVLKDKKQVTADTDFYGYGGFYRPYGFWGGGMGDVSATTSFNVQDYQDGSVIIDMIDAATNKMFWEGIGNAEIDGQINNPDQKVSDAMAKILASFPAKGMQPGQKK